MLKKENYLCEERKEKKRSKRKAEGRLIRHLKYMYRKYYIHKNKDMKLKSFAKRRDQFQIIQRLITNNKNVFFYRNLLSNLTI